MDKDNLSEEPEKGIITLEGPIIDHKISKLIAESIALEKEEVENNGVVNYMARALVQACMPHKKPEEYYFKRRNGNYSLVMTSNPDIGLPYGSIPRLIMIWITTEVVKKKSRELVLGRSLNSFMSELGIPRTGAYIERFKDQTKRLFSCSISCTYDDGDTWQIENVRTVKRASLTWSPQKSDDTNTNESILLLDKDFYEEILSKPVPIDLNVIKKLKNSSLALDIYCWLTYRMSYLKKMTPIPWESLHNQFGSNYAQDKSGRYAFKKKFTTQMLKILALYPDANVEKDSKGLVLYPSKTHIKKQSLKSFTPKTPASPTPETIKKNEKLEAAKNQQHKDRINAIFKYVSQEMDDSEKKKLLADFADYVERRQIKGVSKFITSGDQATKRCLFDFVNSRWHHLLDKLEVLNQA